MSEVQALDERDQFDRAQPVLVADDGEEPLVVGMMLVASKTAVGAGYDADEQGWLKVSAESMAELGPDRARSEAREQLAAWAPAEDATAGVYMGAGDPTYGADDDLTAEFRRRYDLRDSTAGP